MVAWYQTELSTHPNNQDGRCGTVSVESAIESALNELNNKFSVKEEQTSAFTAFVVKNNVLAILLTWFWSV